MSPHTLFDLGLACLVLGVVGAAVLLAYGLCGARVPEPSESLEEWLDADESKAAW